jgi:23S rRNA-/tRNA-specific pseudouridylate synthase
MLYGGIVHEEVVVGTDPSSSGGTVTTTNNNNTNAATATKRKTVFAVLHKPVGLPSHSTVDNAVENLLYQYQHHHRRQDHPVSNYASLPQRLDTETSGLLVVATHPSFARYFSRLLQQKTAGTATASKTPTRIPTIQKRYRCLVAVRNEELWDSFSIKYLQTGAVVEHFVDANSPAPKTFVETRGLDHVPFPSETAPPPAGTAANPTRWQLCRLRISSATGPFRAPHGTGSLRSSPADRPHFGCCFELEIELLTGRTHQIRGQLAALGCPIVGDPLYGTQATTTTNKKDWRNRSAIRMALQCCKLSFPVADDETGGTPRWLDFELDSAWWRNKNHH